MAGSSNAGGRARVGSSEASRGFRSRAVAPSCARGRQSLTSVRGAGSSGLGIEARATSGSSQFSGRTEGGGHDGGPADAFGDLDGLDRADILFEPKAVALCGFRPEECAQFRLLLDELGGREYKVLACNRAEIMHGTVREAISAPEVDWERPRESDLIGFPSPGSPRCIIFSGLALDDVDIVTAVLDENGTPSFAVLVATDAMADQVLGAAVVDAVREQKGSMGGRREFMSWKASIATPETDALKKPIFADDSAKSSFSRALETTSRPSPPRSERAGAPSAAAVEEQSPAEAPSGGKDGEKAENEEDHGKGLFSKPLDLDGVRRDLAQDMRDDKVFMDPWHARGLDTDESRDIAKEEEENFIKKCQERMILESKPLQEEEGAPLSSEDRPEPALSSESLPRPASNLTKEQIIAIAERFEDVDVQDILKRFDESTQ